MIQNISENSKKSNHSFISWFESLVRYLLGLFLPIPKSTQLNHRHIRSDFFKFVLLSLQLFRLPFLFLVLLTDADLLVGVLDFIQKATHHLFYFLLLGRVTAFGEVGESVHFHFLLSWHLIHRAAISAQ